jgi:hypothetical protein
MAPDGSIYVTGYSAKASGGTDITTMARSPPGSGWTLGVEFIRLNQDSGLWTRMPTRRR